MPNTYPPLLLVNVFVVAMVNVYKSHNMSNRISIRVVKKCIYLKMVGIWRGKVSEWSGIVLSQPFSRNLLSI